MAIPKELVFPIEEYTRRVEGVTAQLRERELDAVLLFSPANIYYVSGMDSENIFDFQCCLINADGAIDLLTFDLEAGRAENVSWVEAVHTYLAGEDPVEATVNLVAQRGLLSSRLAIEVSGLGAADAQRLHVKLDQASTHDAFGIVEGLRRVKSSHELALMRSAAKLTDLAVDAGFAAGRVGAVDREVAAAIMDVLYRNGSDTLCWGPIVATGYRAGIAHSTFNGRTLEAGDTIFLEVTGQASRYTSPLMRTCILGEPTNEIAQVAAAGTATVAAILDTARPGITADEVAQAGAATIAPIRDQVIFHNYFGYPVGIGYPGTWIERLGCFLLAGDPTVLEPGMVFHLPISLRKYGEWGVNLSQTIVITDDGAEPLSSGTAQLKVQAN